MKGLLIYIFLTIPSVTLLDAFIIQDIYRLGGQGLAIPLGLCLVLAQIVGAIYMSKDFK